MANNRFLYIDDARWEEINGVTIEEWDRRMALDPEERERGELQVRKGLRIYFDHWRKGTLEKIEDGMDESDFLRMQHPRKKGFFEYDSRIPGAYGLPRPQQRYYLEQTGGKSQARREFEGQLGLILRGFEMAWQPFGISFQRVLGFGGFGIAALFEIQSQPSSIPMPVVVKIDLKFLQQLGAMTTPSTLKDEIAFHDTLRRARHIVQRLSVGDVVESQQQGAQGHKRKRSTDDDESDVEISPRRKRMAIGNKSTGNEELPPPQAQEAPASGDDPPPPGDGDAPEPDDAADDEDPATARELDDMKILMFLEYLELGDLDKWMRKAGAERKRWPSLLLWKIFHCLFKACVGMEYPPTEQLTDDESRAEKTPLDEQAPDPSLEEMEGRKLCHFDIDPKNILVSMKEPTHQPFPIFKIADLGLMIDWPKFSNDRLKVDLVDMIWETRTRGKLHYYTPEQFTEEWDWVRARPVHGRRYTTTAGNYGFHTNLYQCANVMWCLITGCKVQYPPQPTRRRLKRMNRERYDFEIVWSFGGQVLSEEYNDVDIDLREMIVECMSHNPFHRPTISQLEQIFDTKLGQLRRGQKEVEEMAQWCRDFFGSAEGDD